MTLVLTEFASAAGKTPLTPLPRDTHASREFRPPVPAFQRTHEPRVSFLPPKRVPDRLVPSVPEGSGAGLAVPDRRARRAAEHHVQPRNQLALRAYLAVGDDWHSAAPPIYL